MLVLVLLLLLVLSLEEMFSFVDGEQLWRRCPDVLILVSISKFKYDVPLPTLGSTQKIAKSKSHAKVNVDVYV